MNQTNLTHYALSTAQQEAACGGGKRRARASVSSQTQQCQTQTDNGCAGSGMTVNNSGTYLFLGPVGSAFKAVEAQPGSILAGWSVSILG